ncbi:MAG: urate hydroxylase PuuD [Burkholderiaceae bacterium]
MDMYWLDWVNLLLRWTHVIVAIAWIGSSFYFVFLDNSLTEPQAQDLKDKGVDGELWAVHGGGFYNPQKYMVAPGKVPENLHWFFWESYSTWLTGFALFTVLYLFQAGTFLIDRSVYDWSPAAAVVAALVLLVAFWLIYDQICRRLGQGRNGDLLVGILVTVYVVFAAWLACQLFAGRAAFLMVGAMMATAMSANVLFWIIPGQRTVIAQMKAGQPVDPIHGQRAKQRSVHNTYFTLPVIIAMLANHYGWLTQGPTNWLVLCALMLAGALIRHSFVARHQALTHGRRVPWEYAVAGTAIIVVLAWLMRPAPLDVQAAGNGPVTTAQVQEVIDTRCVMCHNAQLQNKNVALHTAELIEQHAALVYQQAVVLKLMPLNNATQMTPAERGLLQRWFDGRAR